MGVTQRNWNKESAFRNIYFTFYFQLELNDNAGVCLPLLVDVNTAAGC